MAIIAIDLGGTKVASAIMETDGTIRFTHKNLLSGRQGHDVGNLVVENINRQLEKAKYHKIQITAIGICIPGSVNPVTGRVWAPNIPQWQNYPLKDVIKNSLEDRSIDIYIDNDRACYVYGEMWLGAAKNCRNVICVAVGTGIGAGIVVDGRALHGADDIIGATGWMALQAPYDNAYDEVGCFEYYASGSGICNRAKDAVRANKAYRGELRQMPISRITTPAVFTAYENGDPIAQKIIDKAIEMWGMASANYVSLLNPEMIVWAGGVFGPAKKFIDRIYDEAKKWAQPLNIKTVKFCSTQLPDNAGLLGAGYLAINNGKVQI
ncbi:MAG: ROK family protein [Bacteroidales bacterium]|nr:ROK family protein [Candidatus Sodaliphilus fimicaballi]